MTTEQKLEYRAHQKGFATVAEYQTALARAQKKANLEQTLGLWEARLHIAEGRISELRAQLAELD